jgi:phosphomevalonate kinase
MIARAPGKVVLSGAYAVLEGAPAIVAAVDRYVEADAGREAARVVPEVAEALRRREMATGTSAKAPWFDARALRDERRDEKLGLGSSAAILVASLAALELAGDPSLEDAALADRVFAPALLAHREAQRGGSGVDVAASAFGGFLLFQPRKTFVRSEAYEARVALPDVQSFTLPASVTYQVWASAQPASTAGMLAKVAELKAAHPGAHADALRRLSMAAEAAVNAKNGASFLDACRAQLEGLDHLGQRSGAPIVTAETRAFANALSSPSTVVLPAGAGGGDVVLVVSTDPDADRAPSGERHGFSRLALTLGAQGVHRARAPHRSAHDEAFA